MKHDFAMTKNVHRFLTGMDAVQAPIKGRIGNALFYGPPGTGKTDVALWYAQQKEVPYIRAKDITSRRSLLSNIVSELGEAPEFRSDALFDQAIESLIDKPRPLIVDEIDYLTKGGIVEVLRDINDITNTPIIMIGMEHAEMKLRRYRHLFDRFVTIVKFELFDKAEIAALAKSICEVNLSDCACDFIEKSAQGKLRLTTTWFARAERIARSNGLELIKASNLQGYKGA